MEAGVVGPPLGWVGRQVFFNEFNEGQAQVLLKSKSLLIWTRSVSGLEVWARKHYAVSLQHTLTLRKVLKSLKTH